jgi:Ca-activated chloride channel family protein
MKKMLLIIMGSFLVVYALSAQEREITGKVTAAEDGSSIPGANVLLKGTSRGVVTNAQGTYKITVPSGGGTLVFSFIGYQSQEMAIGISNIIDVALEVDVNELNEVVVTGYAVQPGIRIRGAGSIRGKKYKSDTGAHLSETYEPLQQPKWNTEEYDGIDENIFHDPARKPMSTFSIDVDAASYSNVRRFVNNGQRPPKDAVRIEELINYFDYDYPQPTGDDPFSITTEIAEAPWNRKHQLIHIGLQGKIIRTENLPPSNLVFLIDVSGSMDEPNKLPLLKASFKMLVQQLRKEDRVAIVVYAGAAGLVLPSTPGVQKNKILDALDNLQAGGSTAGGEGIRLAYHVARENFLSNGNNRVILATDGDFNVGESSNASMERLIEEKRKEGVYLTVLGFGMGNYKDSKMEVLADKGNGNYAYIDNILEAQKVLVNEFGGTLFTIAKDVKLQIEFNPTKVKAYRLIGYENRMLRDEDFNNDQKDAGELGSGHAVTALYEIIPVGVESEFFSIDPLKYQASIPSPASEGNEIMTVKFRYKRPSEDVSRLLTGTLVDRAEASRNASDNFRWSAAVAAFGMLLRDSPYANNFSWAELRQLAIQAKGPDAEGYRQEFISLLKAMDGMVAAKK